jgi:hypothetical protein
MKGYVERFGQSFRVSYDPIAKSFVEVRIDQLRFLPGNLDSKIDEQPIDNREPVLRYAAE